MSISKVNTVNMIKWSYFQEKKSSSHLQICKISMLKINNHCISKISTIALENISPDKIFLLHENICCGYSLEAPMWTASNEYKQYMFLWRYKKTLLLFDWKKSYLGLWVPISTTSLFSQDPVIRENKCLVWYLQHGQSNSTALGKRITDKYPSYFYM